MLESGAMVKRIFNVQWLGFELPRAHAPSASSWQLLVFLLYMLWEQRTRYQIFSPSVVMVLIFPCSQSCVMLLGITFLLARNTWQGLDKAREGGVWEYSLERCRRVMLRHF